MGLLNAVDSIRDSWLGDVLNVIDPIGSKFVGANVTPEQEAALGLFNGGLLNAGLRAATDDKVDFTSKESTEGAGVGLVGGPFGMIAGALAGTAAHAYNESNGIENGSLLSPLLGETGGEEGSPGLPPGYGGSGAVNEGGSGSSGSAKDEITVAENVGGAGSAEDSAIAANRDKLRGQFVGSGASTETAPQKGFGLTSKLGA